MMRPSASRPRARISSSPMAAEVIAEPSSLKEVSRLPSRLKRSRDMLRAAPLEEEPAMRILPSGWTSTAWALLRTPSSTATRPLSPKDPSSRETAPAGRTATRENTSQTVSDSSHWERMGIPRETGVLCRKKVAKAYHMPVSSCKPFSGRLFRHLTGGRAPLSPRPCRSCTPGTGSGRSCGRARRGRVRPVPPGRWFRR